MISGVKLIDIVKKVIKWDKKLEIHTNGKDNAYPEKSDRLINNSVTAKMCSLLMSQFLIGKGFGEVTDDIVINSQENITLIEFGKHVSDEVTKHRGVFIHVNYEIDGNTVKPVNFKVLPLEWCRVGRKDSNDYNGKILVKTDWTDSKETAIVYDVYNPHPAVVLSQIREAKGVSKYRGQVFYYNSDSKYYYPLSRIDAVMEDCDSEAQAGVYKNQLLRKGFFGKTLIVTRPLVDGTLQEFTTDEATGKEIPNKDYVEAQSEADEVQDSLEEFIGADNAGGAMVMQMDNAGDKLEEAILFKNIEANIDPDMFKGVESSTRDNILIAHNNVPIGLVKSNEGLFANSAESIVEMKRSYWENTENERKLVEFIVGKFAKFVTNVPIKVLPLIEEKGGADSERLKAQATLKGSVGGVTALLAIQQSVATKTTQKSAAIAIIEEIYGISSDKASEMLGDPEENTDPPAISIKNS